MDHYLAGVGRALILYKNNLIGVGKSYTQSTFSFSATPEEIRAGDGNALQGRFFHDSNLAVSIVDALFKLEYVALKLGVDIKKGGLSVYESSTEGDTTGMGGVITAKETPVALDGAIMAWYKRPADKNWSVTTQVSQKSITIPRADEGEVYCIKYFYQNENANQVTIPANFNPSEIHIVLMHDLYQAGINENADFDMSHGSKVGRLITDIPRLQLDPNMDLNLTPTSSAPVDFGGTALAVNSGHTCEEDAYYGTMTEELFGASWQDEVTGLAVENGDVEIASNDGTETLIVRALFGEMVAPQRKANSNFTFAIESNPASTASGLKVGASTGVITAGSGSGHAVISVSLTGHPEVEPTFVRVTVV